MENQEREHALLSASGATKWLNCPPSARLEDLEPDIQNEYATEGRFAHTLGELALKFHTGKTTKSAYTKKLNTLKKDPLFYPDMLDHVQVYVDYVLEKNENAAEIAIEQRLDYSNHVPEGFGTGDALVVHKSHLEVIDFKYGKGVKVTSVDNPQLMLYALGAIDAFEILYNFKNVTTTVVQPRLDNIVSETYNIDYLLRWSEDIRTTALQAFKGEGEFHVGEHCRFCKVRHKCKAQTKTQLELAKYEFKEPPFLNVDDIAAVLRQASVFKSWLTSVEKYALDQAVNFGVVYPAFKLVEGKSNRVYTDKEQVLQTLKANGFEEKQIVKPVEVLGITALEKLVGKKKFYKLLKDLIIKPPGKPALVSVTDKRPALGGDAKEDFKG